MKLDNKDLCILCFMIVPAIGFGLILNFPETDDFVTKYWVKFSMMILCTTVAAVSAGILIHRSTKK